jgi:hypothetical protein
MPWEELGKSKVSIDQSNPGISNAVTLTGSILAHDPVSGEAKPVKAVQDDEGNWVLAHYDAYPHGYDSAKDRIKVDPPDAICKVYETEAVGGNSAYYLYGENEIKGVGGIPLDISQCATVTVIVKNLGDQTLLSSPSGNRIYLHNSLIPTLDAGTTGYIKSIILPDIAPDETYVCCLSELAQITPEAEETINQYHKLNARGLIVRLKSNPIDPDALNYKVRVTIMGR